MHLEEEELPTNRALAPVPGHGRSRRSARLRALVSAVLAAALVLTTAPSAVADEATPAEPQPAAGATTFASAVPVSAPNVMCLLDCEPPSCGRWGYPPCELPPPVGCNMYQVNQSASRGDNPELGGTYSRVQFSSRIACTGGPSALIQAVLWDRTSGYNGQVRAVGSTQSTTSDATSSGSVDLYDVDFHPAAQQVEQVLTVEVIAPPGYVWAPCNNVSHNQILWCHGVGTTVLQAGVGFFTFDTQLKRPWRYVALGDSYASGLGAGDYYEGSGSDGCAKSRQAYAHVIERTVVPSLRSQGRTGAVVMRACAGAVTGDVLNSQIGVFDGGVGALIDWVTISIGGNDVGFGPMVENCVRDDCSGLTITPAQLADLETRLRGVYSQVRQRTPNARRMVVLYPQIVPATVGTVCPVGITQVEANAIRTAWTTANNRIRDVARSEQWEVLDSMLNAFDGHSICDSEPFAHGVSTTRRESYHPNAAGHARIANRLVTNGIPI
jgi:lysophospholipase L1-like esterase